MTNADPGSEPESETYNPWTIVNLVFHHLAAQGLHPVLGDAGNPGQPAADLLTALGIRPASVPNRQQTERIQVELEQLRIAVFGDE